MILPLWPCEDERTEISALLRLRERERYNPRAKLPAFSRTIYSDWLSPGHAVEKQLAKAE